MAGISAIYTKKNELHNIYFPVWLGDLKGENDLGEKSNTSNFDENKNIIARY